jgi:hypothetical protein
MDIDRNQLEVGKWYIVRDYGGRYRVKVTDTKAPSIRSSDNYFSGIFQSYDFRRKKYGKLQGSGYFGSISFENISIPRKGSKLP